MTLQARLTPYSISKIRTAGRHSDGRGLALLVTKDGSRRWAMRFRAPSGKIREMGLGALVDVDLFQARRKAEDARALLRQGIDPLERKEAPAATTRAVLEDLLANLTPTWRGSKTESNWRTSLGKHAAALLDRPVAEIGEADIFATLAPIWHTAPIVARDVHQRLVRIFDHARVLRLVDEARPNPCLWASKRLGKQKLERGHFAAVALADVPKLVTILAGLEGPAAAGLLLVTLTALRSGEVLGLRWDEVDCDEALIAIPGARMKAGLPFRTPLSPPVRALLERLPRRGALVFPGADGERLAQPTFERLLRRVGVAGTVHGLRSAFAGWAADRGFPIEIIDAALAHRIANTVTRSYVRGDFFERRREVMVAWADFCTGATGAIVPFVRRG